MRKLAWGLVIVSFMVTVFSFGFAEAAEFLSAEGIDKFMDIEYQTYMSQKLCENSFDTQEKRDFCTNQMILSYTNVGILMITLSQKHASGDQSHEFKAMESCIEEIIPAKWSKKYDSANWYQVEVLIKGCYKRKGVVK